MNKLKEKRNELGITQIEAARACGVSRRTYQTYEETDNLNHTYDMILEKLTALGINGEDKYILSIKHIKKVCAKVFSQYPEIKCAYLFGSYARQEATINSDVDIMLVLSDSLGIKFYTIGAKLENELKKEVDLLTHEQLFKNEKLLEDILVEGGKIYEQKRNRKT